MKEHDVRIISENMANLAEITVANTAADLGSEWLKTDVKGEVCRIQANEGQITLVWPIDITVDGAAIPAWNGSSDSEMRVQVFETASGGSPIYDSGWHYVASGPELEHYDFSQALNVNTFAYGATVSCLWVPNIAARRVIIQLRDPEATFLDISKVIVGATLDFQGAAYGTSAGTNDTSNVVRTAAGELRVDQGTISRAMELNLEGTRPEDRSKITYLMSKGLGKRHFVSGYSREGDLTLTQELMMYGRLTSIPTITHEMFDWDNVRLPFEEW
ncbi:MAG: hypothetical protein M0P09_01235 [Acholeplasmataceae bacterium]|nr:hypothetical protein [Acholeplasmataceae bacterium]